MKHLSGVFYLLVMGAVLISCEESIHSVKWYQEHEAERKIMIEKCNKNPDLIEKNKNCQNAGSAQLRSIKYKKSLPRSWSIEDGFKK